MAAVCMLKTSPSWISYPQEKLIGIANNWFLKIPFWSLTSVCLHVVHTKTLWLQRFRACWMHAVGYSQEKLSFLFGIVKNRIPAFHCEAWLVCSMFTEATRGTMPQSSQNNQRVRVKPYILLYYRNVDLLWSGGSPDTLLPLPCCTTGTFYNTTTCKKRMSTNTITGLNPG